MAAEELGMLMQGGFLRPLPPTATKEEQTAVINSIIELLNDQLKSQVFSDENSKRFVQGYAPGRWPGGDFGIAISAEGDDVLEVDFEQLIFAWDFSTNKQYFRDGTQLYYASDTGDNVGQVGVLPNGIQGSVWAKDGEDVEEAFS